MSEEDEKETDTDAPALPPEQEDRIVDRVVNQIKEIVLPPKAALDDALTDDEEKEPKEPTSVKEIETDMESQVREQLKKIRAEGDHAAEHEKLRAEPEREPVTVGRVTRVLWGEG